MGKIVFAGAMSHVLDPDYYQRACGDEGAGSHRCMAEIAADGRALHRDAGPTRSSWWPTTT